MLMAMAREAAASSRLTTRVLLGSSVSWTPPAGVEVVRIPRGREQDGLVAAAAASEWLVVVAPETAGILEQRLRVIEGRGCRVAGPSAGFAALAADKQATMTALAAAGVPVPAGRLLAAGERPPAAFYRPLVRKRRGSAGCDGLQFVAAGEPLPAAVVDERLEAYVEGLAVSVSVLCGPRGQWPLPPVVQRFTPGPMPAYLGGRLPVPPGPAARAEALAVRAIQAAARAADAGPPPHVAAAGWVGVDIVLGDREDGRGDRVLEINPRVTTSLVGLSQCSRRNLIEAMLTATAGGVPELCFDPLQGTATWDFSATLPS